MNGSKHVEKWTLADEQFEFFIEALQAHGGRVTRLARERFRPTAAQRRVAEYDAETENLRRFLAGAA